MTLTGMTDAEKYFHQKELNRLRQKKYYDANKASLLNKRKESRSERVSPDEIEPTTSTLPSNSTIVDKMKNALEGKSSEKSIKKYVDDIQTFMNITDCNELEKCLKYPKKILKLLDESTKKNSSDPYALNSRKGFIQAVLVAITNLKMKIPKKTVDIYKDYFEKLKIESINENTQKQQNEKVEDFTTYLQTVRNKFGESSKQYLLAKLYDEATLRDDYHDLRVVKNIGDVKDNTTNYIVVPLSSNATLFIQSYKTGKKYGTIRISLSTELSKMIRSYSKTNKIAYGSALFGTSARLSDYVSRMNKAVGIKGSISELRHMKISKLVDNETDSSKRIALSKQMGHSPIVQLQYLRGVVN
jgi:hypothetical protein